MKSTVLTIILMLLISACASATGKAPSCSGARRPANPNGSVLAASEATQAGPAATAPLPSPPACSGAAR